MAAPSDLSRVRDPAELDPCKSAGAVLSKSLLPESFSYDPTSRRIVRSISTRMRGKVHSSLSLAQPPARDLRKAYDLAWLKQVHAPASGGGKPIRVADIFSGCGLMSLGVAEACRAIGYRFVPVLAMDFDHSAAATYSSNYPDAIVLPVAVESYLDRDFGDPPSEAEAELMSEVFCTITTESILGLAMRSGGWDTTSMMGS